MAALEPRPPAQAVLWLELGPALNACSLSEPVEIPLGARQTATSNSAEGPRVVDGSDGYEISCSVRALSSELFEVELALRQGALAFAAGGVLTLTEAAILEVSFMDARQLDCTATVATVLPGAVWLSSVYCGALHQSDRPGYVCAGDLGLIFENCDDFP
jgi:hypothetical protein